MSRDLRNKKDDYTQICCPRCNGLCEICFDVRSRFSTNVCKFCGSILIPYKCNQTSCGFYINICLRCAEPSTCKKSKRVEELPHAHNKVQKNVLSCSTLILVIGVLLMVMVSWVYYKKLENEDVTLIGNLRKNYPSQKNETWYHIMSILDKKIPSVKSITLLYAQDKQTSQCLAKELVFLYTGKENVKYEDIIFSDFNADDYGFVLEYYHAIVKKFGVFVTDLNKISGNVARIFHSLCDEVSSDIKPSLFIFILKYDETTKALKPVQTAASVLQKTWNDLPASELFPLLSRVVKNVIEILPEHDIICYDTN